MDVYYKFQDVFHPLNKDAATPENKQKLQHELMMTADFIGTLNNIKNAETPADRQAMLTEALEGRHKRFASELTYIKNAPTARDGNRDVDSLLVLMNEYAGILAAIKYAPSQDAVKDIIRDCLEL